MEWYQILVFVLLILGMLLLSISGCRGVDRLTNGVDNPKTEQTTQQTQTPKRTFVGGTLEGQNFAVIEKDFTELRVFIKRGEKWVYLDPYDEEYTDKNKPYYVLSEKTVVFFNLPPQTEFSIEVI